MRYSGFRCTCTRCDRTGFINLHQIDGVDGDGTADRMDREETLAWISAHPDYDVSVCDCCGDGENWYGEPGEHQYGEPCECA